MPKQNHRMDIIFCRQTSQTWTRMTMMEPRRMGLHATFGNLHTYLHFRAAQLLSVSGAAGLSHPHWQAEVHLSGPVRPRLPRREMDVNSLHYLYHAETVLKPTYDSCSLCCYSHPNVEREKEWVKMKTSNKPVKCKTAQVLHVVVPIRRA